MLVLETMRNDSGGRAGDRARWGSITLLPTLVSKHGAGWGWTETAERGAGSWGRGGGSAEEQG